MSNKLPIVERTDRICNLINGEIEEPDDDQEPDPVDDEDYKDLTEQGLIERQRRLPKKKKEPEEEHAWMHTHDGGGSFVYTPHGTGIWGDESKLSYFAGNKKRERK